MTNYGPLGRLGARVPMVGSVADVVAKDVAARWIDKVLEADLKTADGAAFAVAQMARRTGDRARDVDDGVRERVIARLEKTSAHASWIAMVKDVVALSADDEAAAFGEALPVGLKL